MSRHVPESGGHFKNEGELYSSFGGPPTEAGSTDESGQSPPPSIGEETAIYDPNTTTFASRAGEMRAASGGPADDRDTFLYEPGLGGPAASPSFEDRPVGEVSTVEDFCRAIVDLGILSVAEIGGAAAVARDVDDLSRALVRAGKLTPYQAGAVAQGKAKGLVVGRYLVLDRLGAGGMGVVFKARHCVTSRVVALKILKPSLTRSRDAVARFRREAEAAARLSHPHVVSVLDADVDRGLHFLVLDYVEGCDLHRLVRDLGPLPIGRTIEALAQAARGLEAAHARGIVHRDIKPANLMLDPGGSVKVLDLGLARLIDAANGQGVGPAEGLTQAHTYMGTVDFMAPEQADDSRTADYRADIYSLGCTAHFLLTGRTPFGSEPSTLKRLMAHQERPAPSLRAARGDVPAEFEDLYLQMMAKRPEDRPASMAEVAARLEGCSTSRQASTLKRADPEPPPTPPGSEDADLPGPATSGPIVRVEEDPLRRTTTRRPGRRWLAAGALFGCVAMAAAALSPWAFPSHNGTTPTDRPEAAGGEPARPSPKELAGSTGPRPRPSDEPPKPLVDADRPSGPLVEVARLDCNEAKPVEAVYVAPDGRTIVSASFDGLVQLWDPATGRELLRLWHPDAVRPVAFLPGGQRAFTGCADGQLREWDLGDGRLLRTIPALDGRVTSAAVSPDGRTILVGGDHPEILVLDAASGGVVRRIPAVAPVSGIAVSPEGGRFLAGCGDGSILLVDADGRGEPESLARGPGERRGFDLVVWCIGVSDDGRRAVTSGDGVAILWDLASRREVRRTPLPGAHLRSVAIEPGGHRALLGLQFGGFSLNGALATWDLDGEERAVLGPTVAAPLGLAVLAGGELVSADADGSVRVRAPLRPLEEARRLAAEGRFDASIPAYDGAVRARPRDARLRIERGRVHASRGDSPAADADFAHAAELADNPQLFLDAGWWVAGLYPPWDRPAPPDLPAGLDPSRLPPAGGQGWRSASRVRGAVDLGAALGTESPRSALAMTPIASASSKDVAMTMRADDWAQLWVDGEPALSTSGGPYLSPWTAMRRLAAGRSAFVASVVNETGGFFVDLRVSDDPADLARAEMARGDWAAAESQFSAAIARSPSVPDTYRDRGDALALAGRWRAADADFRQANAIRPGATTDRLRSAFALLAAEDLSGARGIARDLAKLPALGADPVEGRRWLTLIAAIPDALKDDPETLTAARRLAESQGDPGVWELLGVLLCRAGRWEDALAACQRSLDAGGERPIARSHQALCLAKLRRPGAREARQRADASAPKRLDSLRDDSRRDSSLWIDVVALERLLSEARAMQVASP